MVPLAYGDLKILHAQQLLAKPGIEQSHSYRIG